MLNPHIWGLSYLTIRRIVTKLELTHKKTRCHTCRRIIKHCMREIGDLFLLQHQFSRVMVPLDAGPALWRGQPPISARQLRVPGETRAACPALVPQIPSVIANGCLPHNPSSLLVWHGAFPATRFCLGTLRLPLPLAGKVRAPKGCAQGQALRWACGGSTAPKEFPQQLTPAHEEPAPCVAQPAALPPQHGSGGSLGRGGRCK